MALEQPVCNVFCLRPRPGALADEAAFQVLRRLLREAFGPYVNVLSLPLGGDPLGRAGLTSRTLYDLEHCAHGLVVCGSADARSAEVLDLDGAALARMELPVLALGLAGRARAFAPGPDEPPAAPMGILGLRDDHLAALASRAPYLACADADTLSTLHALGAGHAVLGLSLALCVEPAPLLWEAEAADWGALVTVRDPARMGLPAAERADFVGALRELLGTLRRAGHSEVRLLCADAADLPFATAVARNDFLYVDDVPTFLERMRGCALHVTFREDVALMCAAVGYPFVHVACGPDTRRPLEAAGLAGWSLSLDRADAGGLAGLGARVLERAGRFADLADLRLAALTGFAARERLCARLVRRFAADVLRRRADDAHRRAVADTARLALPVEETRVEVRRTPTPPTSEPSEPT